MTIFVLFQPEIPSTALWSLTWPPRSKGSIWSLSDKDQGNANILQTQGEPHRKNKLSAIFFFFGHNRTPKKVTMINIG